MCSPHRSALAKVLGVGRGSWQPAAGVLSLRGWGGSFRLGSVRSPVLWKRSALPYARVLEAIGSNSTLRINTRESAILHAFEIDVINHVFVCLLVLKLFMPALLKLSLKPRGRNIIFSVDV